MRIFTLLAGFILTFFIACKKNPEIVVVEDKIQIPSYFPKIIFPEGNEFSEARWALGKRLFFDPVLSIDGSISCASCHLPKKAFSDTLALSIGSGKQIGRSNAPTLSNVAYNSFFLRAGGINNLEQQIFVPIQEHDEFNNLILEICDSLNKIPSYVAQAQMAYGRNIDPFVITRAIANFERSIISGNSFYDQYFYQGKTYAMTAQQQAGMKLFFSEKTNCSQCHAGFNFTNNGFENNGLKDNYSNKGRMLITNNIDDEAKFKVPTLRNIAYTAPYMHDGSIKDLVAVVEHYNQGGKNFHTKSALIKPLGLSAQEKNNLLAFLQALSDTEFVNKKIFDYE